MQPKERLSFGVNLSYFFWPGKGKDSDMNRFIFSATLAFALLPASVSAG